MLIKTKGRGTGERGVRKHMQIIQVDKEVKYKLGGK